MTSTAAMPRAIVIGAGLGGLTVAWRLQQAGFEVQVFERETLPSGRVRSVRVGGSTVDTGATVFLSAYRESLALIDEMGLTGQLQAIRGKAVFPRDGRYYEIDTAKPLRGLFTRVIGWRSKLALVKLLLRFLRVRHRLNFLSLGPAGGHDAETLEAYCKRHLPDEVYTYVLNPAIKFLYLHNGSSGSLMELLWWMRASGGGKPRSLRRGTSSLTDALASRLRVHTNTEVTRVARGQLGVNVTVKSDGGETATHHADVCVVTTPAPVSAEICHDGLTAQQRAFLRSRRYDLSIVVSFSTRRRPQRDALMFMVNDEFDGDIATIIFGHNIGADRVPPEQGVVNVYFMQAWSEQHRDEVDEAVMQAARSRIEPWVPEVADLLGWHVQRWPYAAAISEVGDCQRIAAFDADVDPASPIQIVGDFQAQASMNVAVANANQAATRLARYHAR